MRWTRSGRKTCGMSRTVKPCGPGTPMLVLSKWRMIHLRRWQKSPVHRGDHGAAAKTIVQGMPDRFGVPVVTLLVCFFHSHTRLRVLAEHPAFPAPSDFQGTMSMQNPGKPCRGNVVARHCEERSDEAIHVAASA